jgi:hypothetical protein
LTWEKYVEMRSRVTDGKASFERKTVEEHDLFAPEGLGEEIGEMYAYTLEFGYWSAGDGSVAFPGDLGFEVEATRIEDYVQGEDWSKLINQPAPAT